MLDIEKEIAILNRVEKVCGQSADKIIENRCGENFVLKAFMLAFVATLVREGKLIIVERN